MGVAGEADSIFLGNRYDPFQKIADTFPEDVCRDALGPGPFVPQFFCFGKPPGTEQRTSSSHCALGAEYPENAHVVLNGGYADASTVANESLNIFDIPIPFRVGAEHDGGTTGSVYM
jgi:hypothetical protein